MIFSLCSVIGQNLIGMANNCLQKLDFLLTTLQRRSKNELQRLVFLSDHVVELNFFASFLPQSRYPVAILLSEINMFLVR